jgi:hypothetical protein
MFPKINLVQKLNMLVLYMGIIVFIQGIWSVVALEDVEFRKIRKAFLNLTIIQYLSLFLLFANYAIAPLIDIQPYARPV